MSKKSLIAVFLVGVGVGSFGGYSLSLKQNKPELVVNNDLSGNTKEESLEFIVRISLSPTRGSPKVGYDLVLDSRYASALYFKPYDKENSDDVWLNRDKINEVKCLLDKIDFDNLSDFYNSSPASEASTYSFGINYKGKSIIVGGTKFNAKENPELIKLIELGRKIEEVTGLKLYLD
ncbi:hypothetical protein HY837_04020 [archaeon]|nr:hypothetical protein [archaeon]